MVALLHFLPAIAPTCCYQMREGNQEDESSTCWWHPMRGVLPHNLAAKELPPAMQSGAPLPFCCLVPGMKQHNPTEQLLLVVPQSMLLAHDTTELNHDATFREKLAV